MKKTAFCVRGLAVLAVLAVFAGCSKKQAADNSLEELKSRGEFILGLDDSFPPLGFRNDANEIVGFDIDLAKEVAARLGVLSLSTGIQRNRNWQQETLTVSGTGLPSPKSAKMHFPLQSLI